MKNWTIEFNTSMGNIHLKKLRLKVEAETQAQAQAKAEKYIKSKFSYSICSIEGDTVADLMGFLGIKL